MSLRVALQISLCALFAAGSVNSPAAQDETVFLSTNIRTGNPAMPVARSMTISGDRITCVSDTLSCQSEAGTDAEVVDNGDATIMAGLIDTHLHTRLFGQVNGVMLYMDPYGKQVGYEDVFTKIDMCKKHYEAVGLGADYVDQFIR